MRTWSERATKRNLWKGFSGKNWTASAIPRCQIVLSTRVSLFLPMLEVLNSLIFFILLLGTGVPKKIVHSNVNILSESQNQHFIKFLILGKDMLHKAFLSLGVEFQLDLLLEIWPPDGAAEYE